MFRLLEREVAGGSVYWMMVVLTRRFVVVIVLKGMCDHGHRVISVRRFCGTYVKA